MGVGGEEAKIWHWQLLQYLVLPKRPRPERWGGRRVKGTRGPVRGADLPIFFLLAVGKFAVSPGCPSSTHDFWL